MCSEVGAADQIRLISPRAGTTERSNDWKTVVQPSNKLNPSGSHAFPREPLFPVASAWGNPRCRRCSPLQLPMPSIRVKTSRSFYKNIDEEAPDPTSPTPQGRRPRSKSVIETFSGSPFLQSPDFQSPRPKSYAPNLGGARLSRVSQHISQSSREALPGPSTQPEYRKSNLSQDDTETWDEDQTEAVIDHLDVIGSETFYLLWCMWRLSGLPVDPQVATMSNLTNAANSIVMCVARVLAMLN